MYKYIYIVTRKTQIYRPHKKGGERHQWRRARMPRESHRIPWTMDELTMGGTDWNGGILRIITRISHWYWWWLVFCNQILWITRIIDYFVTRFWGWWLDDGGWIIEFNQRCYVDSVCWWVGSTLFLAIEPLNNALVDWLLIIYYLV